MNPLRTAIVAHGRFHAFDLARELHARGEAVTVLSNYPVRAARRFGVETSRYRSLRMHGAVGRLAARIPRVNTRTEGWQHQWFGRWAARELENGDWDVVHCWSGVSEELLRSTRIHARCRALMRGSTHIVMQARLLEEEETRVGVRLDRPSAWMVERERREYDRADRIVVLSEFARASFLDQGVAPEKVHVLPLGVEVRAFRPPSDRVDARLRRIREGTPLTILYAGTLSARKGLHDLVDIARLCAGIDVRFVLVGPTLPETGTLLAGAGRNVTVLDRRAQSALPALYWDADLFIFPTIEDGFGMVITQALAAGLPVLCSAHCAGPDLLTEGVDGWVLPIRSPEAFADRIRWCQGHRTELADMAAGVLAMSPARDWSDVAAQFARDARQWIASTPRGTTS